MNRRHFLRASAATLATVSALGPRKVSAAEGSSTRVSPEQEFELGSLWRPGRLIDTHVYLFQWPFGRLRNDDPRALADKLRRHGIEEAWAGSFERLLKKDTAAVNRRLAEACAADRDLFVPFGTINPRYPDWKDDIRRVTEEHGFRGIRIHPNYHNYDLNAPAFAELLEAAFAGMGLAQGQQPAGAHRVTFGSYSPYFYLESNLLKLRESKLTPEQDEAIRWRVARTLLPRSVG